MTDPLRTARLDLAPIAPSDAIETWPLHDDERMWRYFPQLRPATPQALAEKYERWSAGSPDPRELWLNWLCRDRRTGAPIGTMQATVQIEGRRAFIAYGIFSAYQRRGYAREAAYCIIEHLRGRFEGCKIFAQIHVENRASRALAQSLGFTCTSSESDECLYELAGAPLAGKKRRAVYE